jgi:hypothetical protein
MHTKYRAIGRRMTAYGSPKSKPWRYKASHIMPENCLLKNGETVGTGEGCDIGQFIPAGTLMCKMAPTIDGIITVAPFIGTIAAKDEPYGILESDYYVHDEALSITEQAIKTVPIMREGWFLYDGVRAWDPAAIGAGGQVFKTAKEMAITQAAWTAINIHLEE